MEVIYAFMRTADDLVDSSAPADERQEQIHRFQTLFQQALLARGIPFDLEAFPAPAQPDLAIASDSDRIFPAVAEVIDRYEIPPTYFFEILHGIRMDLSQPFYRTAGELETYCYHVASVVGLICLHVWGVAPDQILPGAKTPVFQAAVACGKALQWTNILRDVLEDAQNGRLYLPLEDWLKWMPDSWLAEKGLTDALSTDSGAAKAFQLLQGMILRGETACFLPVIQQNLARAEAFYAQSAALMKWIPKKNRKILFLITGVYYAIFQKIRKNPQQVFRKRVNLGILRKVRVYLKMFLG